MNDRLPLPSRAQSRAELALAGVTGAAAELVLDATSTDRHAQRVRHIAELAAGEWLRVAHEWLLVEQSLDRHAPPSTGFPYAIAVLVLEAFGVVDHREGPTSRTERIHHRAFRVGAGPRTGNAAGATHAAHRGAVNHLWRLRTGANARGPSEIILRPCESLATDGAGIEVEAPPLPPCPLYVEPIGLVDAQPPGWITTIALEAIRRGMGATPWFAIGSERRPAPHEREPGAHVLDLVRFEGDLRGWGAVVQAATRRVRLEKIAKLFVVEQSRLIAAGEMLGDSPRFILPEGRRVRASDLETWFHRALPASEAAQAVAALHSDLAAETVVEKIALGKLSEVGR